MERSIIEKAASKALVIAFSIKFVIGIALYVVIKRFVGLDAAELFMVCAFAAVLYTSEKLINDQLKSALIDELSNEQQENGAGEKEHGNEEKQAKAE